MGKVILLTLVALLGVMNSPSGVFALSTDTFPYIDIGSNATRREVLDHGKFS